MSGSMGWVVLSDVTSFKLALTGVQRRHRFPDPCRRQGPSVPGLIDVLWYSRGDYALLDYFWIHSPPTGT